MVDQIKITSALQVSLTRSELDILDDLLAAGDRGAFHYVYANMSDVHDALLTTKISTFSETVGGVAFAANWYLQQAYGPGGTLAGQSGEYPGIYKLSQAVANEIFKAIEADAQEEGAGVLTESAHISAANKAWADAGVNDQFPGNFLQATGLFPEIEGSGISFLDLFNRTDSSNPGINASRIALLFAHYSGKRLEDFGEGYTKVTVSDGTLVLDSEGRVTAAFVDAQPDDALAVAGNLASRTVNAPWTLLFSADDEFVAAMMQVGDPSSAGGSDDAIYRAARRNFSEFASGYTGDSNQAQTFEDPVISIRLEATDENDILFAENGTLDGKAGDDLLFGSDTSGDIIKGGDGNDILWGRASIDILDGGDGDDVLRGGVHPDVLLHSKGSDVFDGGDITTTRADDGIDTADYTEIDGQENSTPIKIELGQGEQADKGVITVDDGTGGTDTLFSIERIFATSGDDEVKFTTLQALESLTNVIIDGKSETKYDLLDFSDFTGTLDAETLQIVDGELTIGGVTFKDFEELRDTQKSGRIFGTQSTPAPPPPPPPEGEDPPPPPPSPEQLLQPIIDKVLDSTTRGPDASNPMSRALNILLAEDYQALANIKAVFGGEGDDFIAADAGVLEIRGEAGDDLLIATNALYAPAVAGDDDTPPQPEQRVTIDGGSDNDAVVALFGEKALTVGGEGRDWIWNRSQGGVIYGDTFSGVSATPDGDGTLVAVDYDDPANADNFWWWPDTTIKDAQSNDVLQFFGLPLTGGVQGLPLIAGGGAAALFTPSAGLFSDDAFNNEQGHFFVDNFLVSMNYVFKKDADGNNTLYVVNALDGLMGLFSDVSFEQTSDGSNIRGAMTVENYTITYSAWGFGLNEAVEQGITGNLNMVFKLENKFLAALAWLPPTPGLGGLGKLLPLIDEAASLKAANDNGLINAEVAA